MLTIRSAGPHGGQPVLVEGAPLGRGRTVLALLHGRGATAEGILDLGRAVGGADVTLLVPAAHGQTWYPNRFLAPLASNEPWLTSALDAVGDLVALSGEHGVPARRVVLAGFSQGACLAVEYAVRHPVSWGGVAGLSGGLIGPPGTTWGGDHGSLDGVPVFLGCSDVDAHIPLERVRETAAVFRAMGADVTEAIYPGMGHTVNADEVRRLRAMVEEAGA